MAKVSFSSNPVPGNNNVTLGDSNSPWTIVNPTLTAEGSGVPTAPTAAVGTNTTQIATTAFVSTATNSKADKVISAANGDFAGLDSNGNLTDSGHKHNDYLTRVYSGIQGTGFEQKTWIDLTSFSGKNVWTDGENIYYSSQTDHYVLNKSNSTWTTKTWYGMTLFNGEDIWTDGENVYYSYNSTQYVLNKSTSTWETKTWIGLTSFRAQYIWTDGTDIYYNYYMSTSSTYTNDHYVLNKSTSTWVTKSWTGLSNFLGNRIWTDGENIYYSHASGTTNAQYVLNKETSVWSSKQWNGFSPANVSYIWSDGECVYYSNDALQKVLNTETSTWSDKTWEGLTSFSGLNTWTDGDNYYYSSSENQYILVRNDTVVFLGVSGEWTKVTLDDFAELLPHPLICNTVINIPNHGSTTTVSAEGMTSDYILMLWNFSSSAENDPPVNISCTTSNGSFTITNHSGTDSSETIRPVFIRPSILNISTQNGGQ